jgi:hypothetical protein
MKVALVVIGAILAAASSAGIALCLLGAWLLSHPPADMPAYNPPRAGTTALGLLIILVLVFLLGVVGDLLIGIGILVMGAFRGSIA